MSGRPGVVQQAAKVMKFALATNESMAAELQDMTRMALGKLRELAEGVLVEDQTADGPVVYKTVPNINALTTIMRYGSMTPLEASAAAKNMDDGGKSPAEEELFKARAALARVETDRIKREIENMNLSLISEDLAFRVITAICNDTVAYMNGVRLEDYPKGNEERQKFLERLVYMVNLSRDKALGILEEETQANRKSIGPVIDIEEDEDA